MQLLVVFLQRLFVIVMTKKLLASCYNLNGGIIQKVYTTNGWQVVGSPSSSNSLYGEYVANGGSKTKEEFNEALFNLIG